MKKLFAEVLEIKNGRNQKAVENPNGRYPIYGSGGIMGRADDFICNADTVIIGRKGTINNPIFVNEPFWNVDTAFGLEANRDILSPKYLFYFCKSFNFESLNTTVTIPSLTKNNLLKIKIPIVSLDDQNKISTQLDIIQAAIDNKNQQLSLLDEVVKSEFVELFGDPDINPKGFPVKKINDFANCTAGATPSTKIQEYWENGTIPWMSSGEVHKGRIFETDMKISKLGYDSCSTKMIPKHTVVIALAGQGKTRGSVGVAEIDLCTNQSLCAIITNEEVKTDYLYSYLQLKYEDLRRISNGDGGRGGLNLKLVGNFDVIIPDIELQNKWITFVQQIDKSKFVVKQQISNLQELLNSKMQEYFS